MPTKQSKEREFITVRIKKATYERLRVLGHIGDSIEDVITGLLNNQKKSIKKVEAEK